jgi:hypothetical protein
MHTYNTTHVPITLRVYGRNIQNEINSITALVDNEAKKSRIESIFAIMKIINPNIKAEPKDSQKIWDDLVIMSELKLKDCSPFPEPTFFNEKPKKMPYSTNSIKFRNYGHNLETLIDKIPSLTTKEAQKEALLKLVILMKKNARFWNKQYKQANNFVDDVKIIIRDKELLASLDDINVQLQSNIK